MPNGNDFWKNRLESADPLEVRLDATLAACHSLARYLAYDMSLPPKSIPGLEVIDIIMLINTFTSALVLSMIWTVVGLVTRLFEATLDTQNWSRLVLTAVVSGPIWLILETALEWPAVSAGDAPERIIVGSLGLLATMGLGRIVSSLM